MIKTLFFSLVLGVVAPSMAQESYAGEPPSGEDLGGLFEGFAVRTATTAELSQGEYRIYLVTLYAGNTYRIAGVGDENVSNVDLVLHDSDGNTVEYDKVEGTEPKLEDFTPTDTATCFVVVHLRRCERRECEGSRRNGGDLQAERHRTAHVSQQSVFDALEDADKSLELPL